jgi:hypothetical protein
VELESQITGAKMDSTLTLAQRSLQLVAVAVVHRTEMAKELVRLVVLAVVQEMSLGLVRVTKPHHRVLQMA